MGIVLGETTSPVICIGAVTGKEVGNFLDISLVISNPSFPSPRVSTFCTLPSAINILIAAPSNLGVTTAHGKSGVSSPSQTFCRENIGYKCGNRFSEISEYPTSSMFARLKRWSYISSDIIGEPL